MLKQSALARTLIALVALLALIVAVLSISHLYLPAADMQFVQQRAAFAEALWAIRLHAAGGILALLLGPLQFVSAIRTRRPGVHRWLGRCYLAAIAIGAIGAFGLAPSAFGGLASTLGFSFLAIFWVGSAATAYRCIRVRDIDAHRRWMMRTFALTFAAVTLRIELPILMAIGLEHESAYRVVAWLSWLGNLVLMEFWLRRERSGAST